MAMKRQLFLFVTIIFSSCGVMKQQAANPYEIAYRFIIKDLMTKPQHIAISDSLDEFDYFTALTLLREKNDFSYNYDSLCQVQTASNFNFRVSAPKLGNPFHYLIFSRIRNRMLMAEIIDYQHFVKYGNDKFTTVRLYLLIFDERMKIKKSIVTNVIND